MTERAAKSDRFSDEEKAGALASAIEKRTAVDAGKDEI